MQGIDSRVINPKIGKSKELNARIMDVVVISNNLLTLCAVMQHSMSLADLSADSRHLQRKGHLLSPLAEPARTRNSKS